MKESHRYWLIALPTLPIGDHDGNEDYRWTVFNQIRHCVFEQVGNNAECFAIDLPQFKISTLDAMMSASAELERLDPLIDGILARLMASLSSLLHPSNNEKHAKNDGCKLERLVKGFEWNLHKYRVDAKVADLLKVLSDECNQIDALVKGKLQEHNELKAAWQSGHRKGNLVIRDLQDVVLEHGHVNSEYLQSCFVVVPASDTDLMMRDYMSLAPMTVPQSLHRLVVEDEYALFSLVVFKKHIGDLEKACKSRKWTLRKVDLDMAVHHERLSESLKMQTRVAEMLDNCVRILQSNIVEVFSCAMHCKMLRCFVEAVLRYGLPPVYLFMVIKVGRSEKRVMKALVDYLVKTELPGVSKLELACARGEGDEIGGGGEEADMWTLLTSGGHLDGCPFVRVLFEYPWV